MPSAHIHQVVGQGDEEEADPARVESHAAAPDFLDDGEQRGDGEARRDEAGAGQGREGGPLRRRVAAALEQLPGKTAQQRGDGEVEAGKDPGVFIPRIEAPAAVRRPEDAVAMRSQDGLVDDHRDVLLPVQVHPGAGKGDPIAGEKGGCGDDLPFAVQMDEQQGGDDIAYCDGLERVGEGMEQFPVEFQQVPLDDPAQEEQQAETTEEFQVEAPVRLCAFLVAGHRERDGHPGHEQEERHDEVPQHESFPGDMFALVRQPGRPLRIRLAQGVDDRPQEQQQEQVRPAQDVQRGEPFLGGYVIVSVHRYKSQANIANSVGYSYLAQLEPLVGRTIAQTDAILPAPDFSSFRA